VGEEAEAGVDPGHGRVQLDVIVFEPDGVALEGRHPLQQERVHDVVLGPVVVVDQPHDGAERASEGRRLMRVAGRQGVHGPDQSLTVGAHRLVHGDQDAAVLGDRAGGWSHTSGSAMPAPSASRGAEVVPPARPGRCSPCKRSVSRQGWYGYRAAALIRFSPVHWPDPSVPDRTGSSGPGSTSGRAAGRPMTTDGLAFSTSRTPRLSS
jgi:hypothetical protein